jgi:hypothetical protein
MNSAVHLVNSDDSLALRPSNTALRGDETFYLPLARTQADAKMLAITLTSEEQSRAEALALINRRYAWRGYGSDHKLSGHRDETTFTARFDDRLIGTVTLATDSSRGLAVDATFPEEMQFFRRKQNTRLCELKKLALENGSDAKPVLASMFHFVFIYGTNNLLGTDLLIEVNPRHAVFYERMLKFRRVGAVRTNVSVNAPSQLMWLPVDDIDAAINNNSDKTYVNSLYKYFYDREFEDCIVNELNERSLKECYDKYYY